ncbi:UNVERIFIED_CONTAM: hypothetical protein Sangu_0409900 [Sesamum angustifolium]|uniref:Uncharacterized protein n=1 Tax=Sesamum angustifolium TaxID=2727405 RepID=A0AAW2QSZ0_9LAMI
MDQLSNSFSLLELDAEDAKGQSSTATAAADSCERRALPFVYIATKVKLDSADSDKGIEDDLEDGTWLTNENGDEQTLEPIPVEYKMPLVWIDLEMTDYAQNESEYMGLIICEKLRNQISEKLSES